MGSIFKMYLKGFILKFSVFGRYADLLAGIGLLAAALYLQSFWLGISGGIALAAYAVDLNGIIQRRVTAIAIAKASKR